MSQLSGSILVHTHTHCLKNQIEYPPGISLKKVFESKALDTPKSITPSSVKILLVVRSNSEYPRFFKQTPQSTNRPEPIFFQSIFCKWRSCIITTTTGIFVSWRRRVMQKRWLDLRSDQSLADAATTAKAEEHRSTLTAPSTTSPHREQTWMTRKQTMNDILPIHSWGWRSDTSRLVFGTAGALVVLAVQGVYYIPYIHPFIGELMMVNVKDWSDKKCCSVLF